MRNVLILLICTFISPNLSASIAIYNPIPVSTSMGTFGAVWHFENINDQADMSSTYTSGVTDFATYVGSATFVPTTGNNTNSYLTQARVSSGTMVFDLGENIFVSALAFWHYRDVLDSHINDFSIEIDDTAAFLSPTSLGSFTNPPNSTGTANVFNLNAAAGRFVRINIANNQGNLVFTGISEVAFGGADAVVPEPSSLVIFALSVFGFGLFENRRKRRLIKHD